MSQFQNLPAGPELNALIANRVFGWGGLTTDEAVIALKHSMIQDYSTDPGAAMTVLDRLLAFGVEVSLTLSQSHCSVINHDDDCCMLDGWDYEDDYFKAEGETLALAVCRFALMTIDILKRKDAQPV